MSYTRKELDKAALALIKEGRDVAFTFNNKKYKLDIKEYEANLRFTRPELFKDEQEKR
jgi:hypothetical protein